MYTVSLDSSRFRHLIIIFACLPLLALLLGGVLSRSGLIQADERDVQATPPPPTVSKTPMPELVTTSGQRKTILFCYDCRNKVNNGTIPFRHHVYWWDIYADLY